MKTITVKILLFAGLLLGLNGCYTIIWSPDTEFPTENSSTTIYYGDVYYGNYYYYYDYPWWLDIVPPTRDYVNNPRDENKDIQDIRNMDGRGTPARVPELQPPTRNKPTTTTTEKGSSNNTGGSSAESTVRSSSSSNSGSGSGNNTRNNNGGRSSGGRR